MLLQDLSSPNPELGSLFGIYHDNLLKEWHLNRNTPSGRFILLFILYFNLKRFQNGNG